MTIQDAWRVGVFLLMSGALPVAAQPTHDVRQELDDLKKEVQLLRAQVEEVQRQLSDRPRPTAQFTPIDIQVSGSPMRGSDSARVTLIEFTDYECGYCGRHFSQVFPRLMADFVETGKLRYVVRDYPLVTTHKAASKLAEVALCAGDQDKYWEMREQLFRNQKALQSNDLMALVRQVGVNEGQLQECLDSGRYTQKVSEGIEEGRKAGVRGTPTFFFGLTEPGSPKVTATRILRGSVPYEQFEALIETLAK